LQLIQGIAVPNRSTDQVHRLWYQVSGIVNCELRIGQLPFAKVGNYKTIRLKCALAGAFNYNNFRILPLLFCALLHLIIMKIAGNWAQFCPSNGQFPRSQTEATPFIMSLFLAVPLHGTHFTFDCNLD